MYRNAGVRSGDTFEENTAMSVDATAGKNVDETEFAAKLRAIIGDSEFVAEFERGFAMTLEQAVAMVTQSASG